MVKVCEMIVNRDYIRENNAGHPRRASYHASNVSTARARGSVRVARGCMGASAFAVACSLAIAGAYACMYAGAMLSRTCVEKSGRPGGRARTREDVDIFLRATRECRERHAFD